MNLYTTYPHALKHLAAYAYPHFFSVDTTTHRAHQESIMEMCKTQFHFSPPTLTIASFLLTLAERIIHKRNTLTQEAIFLAFLVQAKVKIVAITDTLSCTKETAALFFLRAKIHVLLGEFVEGAHYSKQAVEQRYVFALIDYAMHHVYGYPEPYEKALMGGAIIVKIPTLLVEPNASIALALLSDIIISPPLYLALTKLYQEGQRTLHERDDEIRPYSYGCIKKHAALAKEYEEKYEELVAETKIYSAYKRK